MFETWKGTSATESEQIVLRTQDRHHFQLTNRPKDGCIFSANMELTLPELGKSNSPGSVENHVSGEVHVTLCRRSCTVATLE